MTDHRRRSSGRVLVTDPTGRALLLRGVDPARTGQPGFWWTPGGGIMNAETPAQAARRELWEEVGLRIGELGPVVLIRQATFPYDGQWYSGTETFFWIKAPANFAISPQAWDEVEHRVIQEIAWLAADEIRQVQEPVYPICLPELLDHLRCFGAPRTPWSEDDRNEPNAKLT